MAPEEKTKQLLVYITKGYKSASVTMLMKLAYLIDLVAVGRTDKQISGFRYRRYTYGPFDSRIYDYLTDLVGKEILHEVSDFCPPAHEYIMYEVNESSPKLKFDKLSDQEQQIADEVLKSMVGYGAKALTDFAYKTKPMVALGATQGGTENLNAPLNLKAK
jgi:hypothetical protein